MRKMKITHLILLLLLHGFVFGQIISYELIENWNQQEVSQLYSQYGIPSSAGEINYSVDGYKILYFTPDFDGQLVVCSGAIFLPVATPGLKK